VGASGIFWRRGVAAASLGAAPAHVDGFQELRPLALLRDAGFEVHAVSRGTSRSAGLIDGVRSWVEPDIARVAGRIALLRPELLFVEASTYGVLLGPLARRSWIRNPAPAAKPAARLLQRAMLRSFDAVSFTNPAARAFWSFPADRHIELPYPLDVAWWASPVPRRDSWWAQRGWRVPAGPVLVCVSAYVRLKRVCELLEMLAPLLAENRSCIAVFVGHQFAEPDTAERLRRMPAELGLADQVLVTGWLPQEQIRELLAWATVTIVNSSQETQCLAVYESLAAGVPALISAIPALTSQFPALPSHASGERLRLNLARLLDDPAWGQELVRAARDRIAWADLGRHDELFHSTVQQLRA
jgi:glycosyltransferase involved in cell wall biosynthesis